LRGTSEQDECRERANSHRCASLATINRPRSVFVRHERAKISRSGRAL
jgi:hypothetical protein